jgi:hypothetical protein
MAIPATSINASIVYINEKLEGQLHFISPDENGVIGVMSAPINRRGRLVMLKTPVASVRVRDLHQHSAIVIPDGLPVVSTTVENRRNLTASRETVGSRARAEAARNLVTSAGAS